MACVIFHSISIGSIPPFLVQLDCISLLLSHAAFGNLMHKFSSYVLVVVARQQQGEGWEAVTARAKLQVNRHDLELLYKSSMQF